MKEYFILLAVISIIGVFSIPPSYADSISGHSKVTPPPKPVHDSVVELGEPLHGKGHAHCKPPRKKHKPH